MKLGSITITTSYLLRGVGGDPACQLRPVEQIGINKATGSMHAIDTDTALHQLFPICLLNIEEQPDRSFSKSGMSISYTISLSLSATSRPLFLWVPRAEICISETLFISPFF